MSTPFVENMAKLNVADDASAEVAQETLEIKGKGIALEATVVASDSEFDENTCAICLNRISISETAQPVGCDHVYCACCILHWAVYKEKPWCPQCKTPFSSLVTFRTLDGQFRDFPCKESICLLKRTAWFQEHIKMREQAIADAAAPRPRSAVHGFQEGSVIEDTDYIDYARYYDEYDDEEEVENYYFSAAAGRARVVIGNRRHGPNGYMSSGRMQARPAATPAQTKGRAAKAVVGQGSLSSSSQAGSSRKQHVGNPGDKRSVSQLRSLGRNDTVDTEEDDASPGNSDRKQSAGRRARRNQRKAAADAQAGL